MTMTTYDYEPEENNRYDPEENNNYDPPEHEDYELPRQPATEPDEDDF